MDCQGHNPALPLQPCSVHWIGRPEQETDNRHADAMHDCDSDAYQYEMMAEQAEAAAANPFHGTSQERVWKQHGPLDEDYAYEGMDDFGFRWDW